MPTTQIKIATKQNSSMYCKITTTVKLRQSMKTNSMRNLTLALTFNKFVKVGRNREECGAQKLLKMIIGQSIAMLVDDSDHFAEKCFAYAS